MLLSRTRARTTTLRPSAWSDVPSASAPPATAAARARREQEETVRRLARELPDIARVRFRVHDQPPPNKTAAQIAPFRRSPFAKSLRRSLSSHNRTQKTNTHHTTK